MATSPAADSGSQVSVTILADGVAFEDTLQVLSLSVTKAVNRIPAARIVLIDGDMSTEDFAISSSERLRPGAEIEIKAGYDQQQGSTIFKGLVARHSIRIAGDNDSCLIVDCQDRALQMTLGRKSTNYFEQRDSDIISKVIGSHGLSSTVDATTVMVEELTQYLASDWDFVLTRADANRLIVLVDDGALSVREPIPSGAAPVLVVTYGEDLMEFHGTIDARAEHSAVTMTTAMRGRVKFAGSSKAKPGTLITLKGVGTRFSGDTFISAVHHEIADGRWVTEAELGLGAEGLAERREPAVAAAPGLPPRVDGLHVGVVSLGADPQGRYRVQVSIPLMGATTSTVWARLLQFHASNAFGAFFMPEVGDEVVLGYVNGDPNDPVILGSLYSRNRTPAYRPDAQNNTKAIVTRTRMKVEFDEAKRVVTITTPSDNKVVLDDDRKSILLSDQNGNAVQLSPSGIQMDSPRDIRLTAAGTITIDAVQKIAVNSSGADVAVSALNITNEAKLKFTGKGAATAELSAAGQTIVKGAMVRIN